MMYGRRFFLGVLVSLITDMRPKAFYLTYGVRLIAFLRWTRLNLLDERITVFCANDSVEDKSTEFSLIYYCSGFNRGKNFTNFI